MASPNALTYRAITPSCSSPGRCVATLLRAAVLATDTLDLDGLATTLGPDQDALRAAIADELRSLAQHEPIHVTSA